MLNTSTTTHSPNFIATTNIEFRIPSASGGGLVVLKVYDVLGNEVATLVNEEKAPGTYNIKFNAINLSSGVYFYELKSGPFRAVKKFVILK